MPRVVGDLGENSKRLLMNLGFLLGVMKMFWNLIVVMVAQLWDYT
jgi:hypothetical protein